MSNRLLTFLRGVLVVGLVLLMAAASSGALGQIGTMAVSWTDLGRSASEQLVSEVSAQDNGDEDNGDEDNGDEDNGDEDNGDEDNDDDNL
jgi:hypothetical protein